MRRIGRAGVGLQSALCLASCSSRVALDDLVKGSTAGRSQQQMHTHTHKRRRDALLLLGRRVERARSSLDNTTGVSVTDGNIELQRDRQSRRCVPGQSCHCDGLGPTGGSWVGEGGAGKCGAFRVWKAMGRTGTGRRRLGAVPAGAGPIDCYAAPSKVVACVLQMQEPEGFLARLSR